VPDTYPYVTCKLDILKLVRCKYNAISGNGNQKYLTISASPATGILYITQNSPDFMIGGTLPGGYFSTFLQKVLKRNGIYEHVIDHSWMLVNIVLKTKV
jgi:hypothetical protein